MEKLKKIYFYKDYKKFTNTYILSCPNNGRGQLLKISKFLGVHSTLISQVLRGSKDFSLEQSHKLCEYMGLNELETEYFMTLIQKDKAGSHQLKEFFNNQLTKIEDKFQEVSSRVVKQKKLKEKDIALYYSDWRYMATWLATSLDNVNNVGDISRILKIPAKKIALVIDFLTSVGLCTEKDNTLTMGVSQTHLDATSPLITRHHTNWRLKAIESFQDLTANELAFTAPLTVSKEDFVKIRNDILELIEKTSKMVSASPAEKISCLSIDLFDIK